MTARKSRFDAALDAPVSAGSNLGIGIKMMGRAELLVEIGKMPPMHGLMCRI